MSEIEKTPLNNPFVQLGLAKKPIMLAPLAGVSDIPFRRICQFHGADLCYIEMLSATALVYGAQRSFRMLAYHPSEVTNGRVLGVQITSNDPQMIAKAVEILEPYPFATIDINMGCPVRKVTKNGSGCAIMKDPERAFKTVLAAVNNSSKVISAKMRLGFDHDNKNVIEVAEACVSAGAKWITLHGRTRNDSYSVPVDLDFMAQAKQAISVPLIGNGNLFYLQDMERMQQATSCDGYMISRGALGNPWVFSELKNKSSFLNVERWYQGVKLHLQWQEEAYKKNDKSLAQAVVCMRKHLIWYVKGWLSAKVYRDRMARTASFIDAIKIIDEFYSYLLDSKQEFRFIPSVKERSAVFSGFDPKFDMDRKLDSSAYEVESALSIVDDSI